MKAPAIAIGTAILAVVLLAAYWVMYKPEKAVANNVPAPVTYIAASSAPTPSQEVRKPAEIEGLIDPKHDVESFIGTPVLNECGTIGKPTNCLLKEVEVKLPEPVYTAFGDVHTHTSFIQLTLKTQDAGYVTLAYAFFVSEDGTIRDGPRYASSMTVIPQLNVGQPYRFGRNRKTVVFRYGDHGEWRSYYRLLARCSSIHECQSIPYQMGFSLENLKTVAPWEWQEFQQREQEEERQERYLDTPR